LILYSIGDIGKPKCGKRMRLKISDGFMKLTHPGYGKLKHNSLILLGI
jgi:hypothetical protein